MVILLILSRFDFNETTLTASFQNNDSTRNQFSSVRGASNENDFAPKVTGASMSCPSTETCPLEDSVDNVTGPKEPSENNSKGQPEPSENTDAGPTEPSTYTRDLGDKLQKAFYGLFC